MDWTKAAVALSIIAILVSAASVVYTFQVFNSLSQQLTQLSGFPGPELFLGEAALYQKAKQEGTVIMLSVWDVGDLNAMAQGFQKRYPGIVTEFTSLRNPEIISRLSEEYRAGKRSVDVIGSDSAPVVLYPLGAIQDYQTVQKDKLIVNDPRMVVVSIQVQVIGYNTKKLDTSMIPKSYEDLTNPRYKGLVAMDDPLRGGPLTWMLLGLKDFWKDNAKWTDFVKGLKALNAPLFKSTGQMARLVVSGEFALCIPCLTQDVIQARESGAPVDWAKSIPPILFPRFAAIYKLAPHPSAARLLAEWLASSDSAPVWCSLGRSPGRANVPCGVAIEQAFPIGSKTIAVDPPADPAKFINEQIRPIWETASASTGSIQATTVQIVDFQGKRFGSP